MSGLTLVGAQAAVAQTPTPPPAETPTTPPAGTPTTPPVAPPATAADVSISIAGDRGDLDVGPARDEEVQFDVFVANFGPGTARNVRVVVSLPEEFDANSLAGDLAECEESNASEEGDVICNLGDLTPDDKRQLEFNIDLDDKRGSDRDRTSTVVSILADSDDSELDNNSASRDLEIEER